MNEYIVTFTKPLPPLNFRVAMQHVGAREIHTHYGNAQIFARPESHRGIIDTLTEFADAGLIVGFLAR